MNINLYKNREREKRGLLYGHRDDFIFNIDIFQKYTCFRSSALSEKKFILKYVIDHI